MPKLNPKPENLAQLVFLVRGEKVLLDADLAMLYGVETGALNRAVKRNVERFPADFMFLLSDDASFITGTDLPVDGGYNGLGPEGLGQNTKIAGTR